MPSTYTKLYYHLVFSTKERRPLIETAWGERLYAVIGGIIRVHHGVLLAAGGMPDHVHLLVSCRPTVTLSSLLRDIKCNSSNWVHEQFTKDFAWQEGYSAFTVSHSGTPDVKDYIANQKEHHRKRDYKEELLAMLKLNEILSRGLRPWLLTIAPPVLKTRSNDVNCIYQNPGSHPLLQFPSPCISQ